MRAIATVLCALALIGCGKDAVETTKAAAAASQFTIVGSNKQVMQAITIPSSEVIFGIGDKPPQDDAGWLAVESAAIALAESGNLMQLPGRAMDTQEWAGFSRQLTEKSVVALKAAQARNADQVLEAGNDLYQVCEDCHKLYMPQPK
jgi:hypothetical protein